MFRQIKLAKAGDSIPGHTHNYDHVTIVIRGKVNILGLDADGSEVVNEVLEAPQIINVPKDLKHRVIALTDDSEVWCVFPHRDKDSNLTDSQSSYEAYQ